MKFDSPAFDLRPRPHNPDHLSPTGKSTYLRCGLQWRLGHVDGIVPIKRGVATALGTAFHNGLRPYWKGQPSSFLEQWKKVKGSPWIEYKRNDLSWLDWYSRGQQMTQALMSKLDGHFDPSQSRTEINYDLDLGFIKLFRRLDVYTVAKKMPVLVSGNIESVSGEVLIDVKSSAQRYADESTSYSQQLALYSVPGRDRLLNPTMAIYAVVTKSAKPQVQLIGKRYEKEELRSELISVKQVHDNIRAGIFLKNPDRHCAWCDYRHMCVLYKANWKELYRVPGDRPGPDANNSGADAGREASGNVSAGPKNQARR